ncbi:MAG TPA: M48 family metalloprotease [Xanthobacteraceae bacterium]|nr:M48 family metalloprotease [Xanthobacteraceae bacterium]
MKRLAAVALAAAIACTSFKAEAQQGQNKGLPLIRDAEIEQLLREYSQPILRAAGLGQHNIQVVIIREGSFNAFVADGRRIFINHGALLQSKTPNQVIGVFAHETGHIAGGHLAKMREEVARAQNQMIVAMLLGAGAIAAGSRSGSGVGQAGMAAISAPQEVIRRTLLSYARQHEENADRAAVKFLNSTGQSARGMHETFRRFVDEGLFSTHGSDPYVQSHPMARERVAALEQLAQASPHWNKVDPPALQLRHDMMRAKLTGFLSQPDAVRRLYPPSDQGLPAQYARAISRYRHGDLRVAISLIDGLIKAQPGNPYFQELKGQALLESGRPAEAIAPLRKAVQMSNRAPLIEMLLGQALVATENRAYADEAIDILRRALVREPDAALGYTQLAMAYSRKGLYAEADLASAQAAYARGDTKTARDLALRAKSRFAVGAPGWVQADDILNARKLGQKN